MIKLDNTITFDLAPLGAPDCTVTIKHPKSVPHGVIRKMSAATDVVAALDSVIELVTGWNLTVEGPDGQPALVPFRPGDPSCLDPVPVGVIEFITQKFRQASEVPNA